MPENRYFYPCRAAKNTSTPLPVLALKSSSAASSTKGLSQWATGRMGTIARLNPEAMKTYEESLKTYWDNYSVLQTARNEGKE
jgi:hypothetical protein